MRRWRCPDCRAVHTARPSDYPPGSAYLSRLRIDSLKSKIEGGNFLPDIPRQTQQYWNRAFNFCLRRQENWPSAKDFLNKRVIAAHIPVSFNIKYRVIPSGLDPPYLNFAVTQGSPPVHL